MVIASLATGTAYGSTRYAASDNSVRVLAAKNIDDTVIVQSTAAIAAAFSQYGYVEKNLTQAQCAINVKGAFVAISRGSTLQSDLKDKAVQATTRIVIAWIANENSREAGLTLEQCTRNIFGSSLVILQGSPDSKDDIINTLEPMSMIVSTWLSSGDREKGLTVEQCTKNILGSMLSINHGSPGLSMSIKASSTAGTGRIVAQWLKSSYREKGLTVEQCTRNILGKTYAVITANPRSEAVTITAIWGMVLDVVKWLPTRSLNSPTTEQQTETLLKVFLGS